MGEYVVDVDYSGYLDELVNFNSVIAERLELLDSINQLLINLNGYFYLLIFGLAGVGLFYLFYRFLRIFI